MVYPWLPEKIQNGVFTAFDTETTGLYPESERIVEIGAIRFDRRGIIARYNVLVHPEKPMPEKAAEVNGITDDILRGCPVCRTVLPDFLSFIQGSVLVAHNAPFDISFVNMELQRAGMPPLENACVDTIALAKEAFPGMGKYALQFLAPRLGIEVLDAHRAEDDARVCMELFLACVRQTAGKN